jgi:hypothetical protein
MRFPVFATDFLLIALAVSSVMFSAIYPNVNNFALSIISVGLCAAIAKRSHDAHADFEKTLSAIEGLEWTPVFFSAGSILMRFGGHEFIYSSSSGYEKNGVIPVGYSLTSGIKTKKQLEIRGTDAPGYPEISGDKKLFSKIKKEVLDFDKVHGVSLLQIDGGVARFSVCLGFSKARIPNEEKLDDMAKFLKDYLEFASIVIKKLD